MVIFETFGKLSLKNLSVFRINKKPNHVRMFPSPMANSCEMYPFLQLHIFKILTLY